MAKRVTFRPRIKWEAREKTAEMQRIRNFSNGRVFEECIFSVRFELQTLYSSSFHGGFMWDVLYWSLSWRAVRMEAARVGGQRERATGRMLFYHVTFFAGDCIRQHLLRVGNEQTSASGTKKRNRGHRLERPKREMSNSSWVIMKVKRYTWNISASSISQALSYFICSGLWQLHSGAHSHSSDYP